MLPTEDLQEFLRLFETNFQLSFGLPIRMHKSYWICPILCLLLISSSLASTPSFIQLSDLHLDVLYRSGSSPTQACHRGVGPAGKYGIRLTCDAPADLVNAVVAFSKSAGNGAEFIVWTGDNARHDSDILIPRTSSDIYSANQKVAAIMNEIWPSTPLIPSIGNNDVYPHDQLCFGPNENLGNLSQIWSKSIPPMQQATFQRIGCFSTSISSKLIVLSFNTLFMYRNNECGGCGSGQPGAAAFEWLEQQLISAANNDQQIYITGHIPPDGYFWYSDCQTRYLELTAKYGAHIAGHLYGHTHQDNFVVLNDPVSNSPIAVINISPSGLSTFNPSLRKYHFDPTNGQILDYTQYYSNLTQANDRGAITFESEYSWLNAYGFSSYSISNWATLANQILTRPDVAAKYLKYRYLSSGLTQFMCSEEALARGTCVLHMDSFSHIHP